MYFEIDPRFREYFKNLKQVFREEGPGVIASV